MKKQLEEAKKANENKIGEPKIPNVINEEDEKGTDTISVLEQLQMDYKEKFNSEVPIRYKNDEAWIAKKLAE